jgi:hypothetical protein
MGNEGMTPDRNEMKETSQGLSPTSLVQNLWVTEQKGTTWVEYCQEGSSQ